MGKDAIAKLIIYFLLVSAVVILRKSQSSVNGCLDPRKDGEAQC